ncbi:MAG: cation transporter [bacterium]|nr:cation transporter [bacterium]
MSSNTPNVSREHQAYVQNAGRRGLLVTVGAMAVNTLLALVKLTVGWIGGSYALVADGVESCADIFGSLVVWGGIKIAAKPADENHPYGHGRADALAALFVAMMLLAAGVGISVQAVRAILHPRGIPAAYTLWVLLGVVLVKEVLFRRLRRHADALASTAVLSDAWHHRCDAVTSAAAAVGITIALVGGEAYQTADAWAALVAAGVILLNAVRLARVPIRELMDAEPTQLISQVRTIAEDVAGVEAVEKITARKAGLYCWVDMHIEVDPQMTVCDGHKVAHVVQDAICTRLPQIAGVLVHVEPAGHTAGHGKHRQSAVT